MRNLKKNKRKFILINAIGEVKAYDENGRYTGERVFAYSEPYEIALFLSGNSGDEVKRIFGELRDYDRYSCVTYNGIEAQKPPLYDAKQSKKVGLAGQSTKLFIAKDFSQTPLNYVYDANGNKLITMQSPNFNYEVVALRDTLNELHIALKEVTING